jgi:hypothetical protein
MAALFALGAMSVAWMAVVAVLIALEKLLPWRRVAVGAVTAILVALAIAVAAAPEDVPGLTLPSEGGHMSGMGMDDMKRSEERMAPAGQGGGSMGHRDRMGP